MNKKYFLLVFFAFLIIIPSGQVSAATPYFIGVTIASAQAPGYGMNTDNNWCLHNGTTLAIRYGSGIDINTNLPVCTALVTTNCYVTPTVNPTPMGGPVCAGNTVWSALVNISSGIQYQIYFKMSNSIIDSCPGYTYTYSETGYCMVSWDINKNCCETCAHYGLAEVYNTTSCIATESDCNTVSIYDNNYYSNFPQCGLESFLMGKECSECHTGAAYSYYNPSTRACYTKSTDTASIANYSNIITCDVPPAGYVRTCRCAINLDVDNGDTIQYKFLFPFTPVF